MLRRWVNKILGREQEQRVSFQEIFTLFQEILSLNNRTLDLIAEANDKLSGDYIFDRHYIETFQEETASLVHQLIYKLNLISPGKYQELNESFHRIESDIRQILAGRLLCPTDRYVLDYKEIAEKHLGEAAGGKNTHLAEIMEFLGITIPPSFAITTAAYFHFLQENGLPEKIEKIIDRWHHGETGIGEASKEIRSLILAARLPADIRKEIDMYLDAIRQAHPEKKPYFAVRSSAVGEDSEFSYAGQYASRLNVSRYRVIEAYREVVASVYSERAMEYRQSKGVLESEIAMAVACQQVVKARVSGVLYTYHPVHPEKETMEISSAWGLGAPIVSGRVLTDHFTVARRAPHEILELKVVRKQTALMPAGGEEKTEVPVPEEQQTIPSLTDEQLRRLAEIGLRIEKFYKKPQDIEFAIDENDEIVILQARQLAMRGKTLPVARELAEILEKYPVISRGRGTVAQMGIASGTVFVLENDEDLDKVPQGAILVARYASPRLARVIRKVSGIITDVGAVTGHLATVAREFRVPTIMNLEHATEIFETGEEVTIDAQENIVYEGLVRELYHFSLAEEDIEETYEYRLLRRVLKKIEPLYLLDPKDPNFTPQGCRTLHDIIRFVHEKVVEEIIDYNYHHPHNMDAVSGKLDWKFPLDMVIIDMGGGLVPGAVGTGRKIVPEQITSPPMRALLDGIAHPGAWNNEPMSVDFGSFMSSLTRTMSAETMSPRELGQNLAVISDCYINVSLRLGYHFTVIDAYVVDNVKDNYAYFRFSGGVTDISRRSRRAAFIGEALARHDFHVELHEDLVEGRIKKMDRQGMLDRLNLLGILIGFTRQLDVKMVTDEQIAYYIEKLQELLENDNHE